MIGAGGQAGGSDAANLLKPALARGELRTIAATTWAEYKKYFEKDAALARRFQVVKVEEPDEKSGTEMMRGLVGTLEKHHHVRILNEAVIDAVRLSNRYISGRQLPDKAVSVLDTTCARIGISQTATPPPVEDARRRIDQFGVLTEILKREAATGADHQAELADLESQCETVRQDLAKLEAPLAARAGTRGPDQRPAGPVGKPTSGSAEAGGCREGRCGEGGTGRGGEGETRSRGRPRASRRPSRCPRKIARGCARS